MTSVIEKHKRKIQGMIAELERLEKDKKFKEAEILVWRLGVNIKRDLEKLFDRSEAVVHKVYVRIDSSQNA